MNLTASKLDDLDQIAVAMLDELSKQNLNILTLIGDLGAGKTTFTQRLAKHLGIEEAIQSPTFILMNEYVISAKTSQFKKLFHIDAYRLDNIEEVDILDLAAIASDPRNLIIIEWADKIHDAIKQKHLEASIRVQDQTRQFNIESH